MFRQINNVISNLRPRPSNHWGRKQTALYSKYRERLGSFYREFATEWPIGLQQKPDQLAEAGFVYSGMSDRVECFYCKITVHKWSVHDDPWEEHVKWSPKCGFLNLIKSPEYVRNVQMLTNRDVVVQDDDSEIMNSSNVDSSGEESDVNDNGGRDLLHELNHIAKSTCGFDHQEIVQTSLKNDHQSLNSESITPASDTKKLLQEEVQTLKEDRLCTICLDNEKATVIIPCGHVTCNLCILSLSIRENVSTRENNSDMICPICRSTITNVVKAFIF